MRLNPSGLIPVVPSLLLLAAAVSAPSPARAQVPDGPGARPPDVASQSPRRRPLSLRADYGGTEPTTARQAFEGVLAYRGEAPYEVQAGFTYSDQLYYASSRGFVSGYRYFNDGQSYVKADGSLRKYRYPADQTGRPNPDSNAYDQVWRGELEASHGFTEILRGTVQYQLFRASFFHDGASWSWNQKLTGEVELRVLPGLRLGVRAAALRDPDPGKTAIRGRNPADKATPATQTKVVYRTTQLVGGWGALELGRAALKLELLPNRDLDNSYAWSLLTTLDVTLLSWLDVRLQQVHDRYASISSFSGRTADIWMAAAGFRLSEAVRLRAGYRHVDLPAQAGRTTRDIGIVGFEWRTPLP
jgi:hypothetical protein